MKGQISENPLLKMDWNLSLAQKAHNSFKALAQVGRIRNQWEAMPQGYRKAFGEVIGDLFRSIWRYDCKAKWFMEQYFTEATWRRGCDLSHYILWGEWLRLKSWADESQRTLADILNRKGAAAHYWAQHAFPVAEGLGTLEAGQGTVEFLDAEGYPRSLDELLDSVGGIFVKPDDGTWGERCASILPDSRGGYILNGTHQDKAALWELVHEGALRVERLIIQHPRLAALHPPSINTLRLVTMVGEGEPRLMASVLRIGTGGRNIDNWSAGGLAVRIGEHGRLAREGWYKGGTLPPCWEHPDTHLVFGEYEIPFFHEAVDMAMRGHRLCSNVFGIGWDVAITPDGPLLIESNVNFGIGSLQYFYGGLREVMERQLRPLAEAARRKMTS